MSENACKGCGVTGVKLWRDYGTPFHVAGGGVKKDAGFTLIEMLIVLIICGILGAIIVFAIGAAGGNDGSQDNGTYAPPSPQPVVEPTELPDGTHCALYRGSEGAALSCAWLTSRS